MLKFSMKLYLSLATIAVVVLIVILLPRENSEKTYQNQKTTSIRRVTTFKETPEATSSSEITGTDISTENFLLPKDLQ